MKKWCPGRDSNPHSLTEKRILSRSETNYPEDNVRLINRFILDRELRGLSHNSIKFYKGYLARFVKTLSASLLIQSKRDIIIFITSRKCNAGGKHAYFRVLRAFYKWCLSEDLLDRSPMTSLRAPKVPKPIRPSLSQDSLIKLLNNCLNLRDKLIVSLLADTGLRLSELANIEQADIDQESKIISVWGKGSRQRLVAYGQVSGLILQKYLLEAGGREKLFDLLPRGISEVLKRLGDKTGIACNAHIFRRTFATYSIRNNMNLFHVQSLLGHSNLNMTRIYAEQVNSEDAVKAYTPIVRKHCTHYE